MLPLLINQVRTLSMLSEKFTSLQMGAVSENADHDRALAVDDNYDMKLFE